MKRGIKYIYEASFLYTRFKKHFCPICGDKLNTSYETKIVNSKSEDAKNYDFELGDSYLIGDVEFRKQVFCCHRCKKNISIRYMKKHEKDNK